MPPAPSTVFSGTSRRGSLHCLQCHDSQVEESFVGGSLSGVTGPPCGEPPSAGRSPDPGRCGGGACPLGSSSRTSRDPRARWDPEPGLTQQPLGGGGWGLTSAPPFLPEAQRGEAGQ